MYILYLYVSGNSRRTNFGRASKPASEQESPGVPEKEPALKLEATSV